MSKGLKKSVDAYRAKSGSLPVHAALVERMQQRDPLTAPRVGDRVPYVMIEGLKRSLVNKVWKNISAGEMAEDPAVVAANNLPIDSDFYIGKQLVPPFVRLLNLVLCKDQAQLADTDGYYKKHPERTKAYEVIFKGAHMMHRKQRNVSGSSMMSKMVQRVPTCLACRCAIPGATPDNAPAVCPGCAREKPVVYMRIIGELRKVEAARSAAWTRCQRCQGSLMTVVTCGNKECDNFFYRDTMVTKHKELLNIVARF
jgi:DNA polymerase delta subunit 1